MQARDAVHPCWLLHNTAVQLGSWIAHSRAGRTITVGRARTRSVSWVAAAYGPACSGGLGALGGARRVGGLPAIGGERNRRHVVDASPKVHARRLASALACACTVVRVPQCESACWLGPILIIVLGL